MIYPVTERFHTFQGEGLNMGLSAFFIRLHGCPLHCGFCDSANTWHPQYIPETVKKFTAKELVQEIESLRVRPALVVVTGGEPAIHDLRPLTEEMKDLGIRRCIETSGAFPIRGDFDFITVSPKWAKLPLKDNLYLATELKLIIEQPADIRRWNFELAVIAGMNLTKTVWLHPEWSQRNDPLVLSLITSTVKEHSNFRAGYQIHKLYKADLHDERSVEPAPLGGDPEKGY